MSYRGHRSSQVDVQVPILKQEPEERAQGCRHQLCAGGSHATAMPQHEIRNLGRFQLPKQKWSLSKVFDKELTNEKPVIENGGCDEPAL